MSQRPTRPVSLAIAGVLIAIVGAFLFAYSFTAPLEVCNPGPTTRELGGLQYDYADMCGPAFVNSQYTYAFNAATNGSIGLYLVDGKELFLNSTAGSMSRNASIAQAFIMSHPQAIGYQAQLTTPLNITYSPRTNTSIILVLLNTDSRPASFSLASALFFQPVPVGLYLLAGLVVVPAGVLLTTPYLFARRRREQIISQQEIGS